METIVQPSALRVTDLFAKADNNFVESLAAHCKKIQLKADQPLFKEGEQAKGFYILNSGLIKLFKLNGETENIFRFVRPNEAFAEAAIFQDSKVYPINASACTKSELIFVPAEDLLAKMKTDWNITSGILRSLAIRLKHHIEKIELISCRDPRIKFALFLMQITPIISDAKEPWTEVSLELKRRQIAQQIGVTPETMSRTVKIFTGKKLVKVGPRRILAVNRSALQKYLETQLLASD